MTGVTGTALWACERMAFLEEDKVKNRSNKGRKGKEGELRGINPLDVLGCDRGMVAAVCRRDSVSPNLVAWTRD